MLISNADWVVEPLREPVMGFAVQHPSGTLLVETAPLLEEEWHTRIRALVADRDYPLAIQGPRASSTLPANNDPVNAV